VFAFASPHILIDLLKMAAKRAIHIVAISGSLRAASANTGLLRACAARLPEATTMEIIVPNLPLFNQDTETELNTHPDIVSFREKVKAADAILFACPEYK
jgi:chromate reductase